MSAAHGHENHDHHNAHDSHSHENGFSFNSLFNKLGGIRNFLEDVLDLSGKRLGEVNLNPVQAIVDVSRVMVHKVEETRHAVFGIFSHGGGGHGHGH